MYKVELSGPDERSADGTGRKSRDCDRGLRRAQAGLDRKPQACPAGYSGREPVVWKRPVDFPALGPPLYDKRCDSLLTDAVRYRQKPLPPPVPTWREVDRYRETQRSAALKIRTRAIITTDSFRQRFVAAGGSMIAVHCGSAASGVLINHMVRENGQRTFSIHGADATLTPEVLPEILAACVPVPPQNVPKSMS